MRTASTIISTFVQKQPSYRCAFTGERTYVSRAQADVVHLDAREGVDGGRAGAARTRLATRGLASHSDLLGSDGGWVPRVPANIDPAPIRSTRNVPTNDTRDVVPAANDVGAVRIKRPTERKRRRVAPCWANPSSLTVPPAPPTLPKRRGALSRRTDSPQVDE
jgi:hypothetical protein